MVESLLPLEVDPDHCLSHSPAGRALLDGEKDQGTKSGAHSYGLLPCSHGVARSTVLVRGNTCLAT